MCELVESRASGIRSGWKVLFGALRSVKIESAFNSNFDNGVNGYKKLTSVVAGPHRSVLKDFFSSSHAPSKTTEGSSNDDDREVATKNQVAATRRSVAAVMDVFEAFIATNDVQV